MDQEPQRSLPTGFSRREALKLGLTGLACAACGGAGVYYCRPAAPVGGLGRRVPPRRPQRKTLGTLAEAGLGSRSAALSETGAKHPVQTLPERVPAGAGGPGPLPQPRPQGRQTLHAGLRRSVRVHIDPIEKKPLLHFLPGTTAFSLATAGCGLRCLNCQNWDISQRKPEETKDPRGEPMRLTPATVATPGRRRCRPAHHAARGRGRCGRVLRLPLDRLHLLGTDRLVRVHDRHRPGRPRKRIKNCWITCGYIQEEPLVELCQVIDVANVNLKSFSEEITKTNLNQ